MMRVLPQLFYQTPEVDKILVDGLSCIVHKVIHEQVLHKEGYVSAHAITLVLKGLLQVENDDGEKVQVKPNQMIFLPKGLYNISDIIPDNQVFEAVVFFFDEALINEFIAKNNIAPNKKDRCVSYKVMDYTPEIRSFTESVLTIYKNKPVVWRTLTRIKLFELLHILSFSKAGCLLEAIATLNNKEKKSLREFMATNFAKPLSIEDYAYLTGRSLSTFRRDFIEQFGISPKQWLIEKRLDKARELLERNHTTVSQVSLEVGYENFSHFVKAFHKKFGTPPKQFLMRARKEVLV
jgi:AraC family transcriptional regulator, exoenzyme S synthesis regulatory protein ExsA